jgi:hypothetical protein
MNKTTQITKMENGGKKIVETRDRDHHEASSLINSLSAMTKQDVELMKSMGVVQSEPKPEITINNNNQQMQVSEAVKQDLHTLNTKLIEANIDDITNEN